MAYREGKEIYRVKSTLNAYQKNLDHLLEAMDANRDEKADLEHQLITGKLSKPQRIAIIKRMRELEKEKDEVSHKIDEHEYQVAQLRENLRMLQLNSGNY